MKPLKHIPTNIITGFLGVGKTTAISHLLRHKPAHERWAVLVNEFGEVGIDGGLLQGQHAEAEQVFVAEVPGGCMCCVMGMPTKITLNKLLKQAQPDRLLIEPTGLGHPQEVLALLASEHYQQVLDVRSTITLVDARVIDDPRYTEHAIFNQQLDVADVIVANKSDCYDNHLSVLTAYLSKRPTTANCPVMPVEQGQLSPAWLDLTIAQTPFVSLLDDHVGHEHQHHGLDHTHDADTTDDSSEQSLPAEGYVEVRNHRGDYFSCGWRFSNDWLFDEERLEEVLRGLACERMKAVFNTNMGAKGFSFSNGELSSVALAHMQGSRIEIIDRDARHFDTVLSGLLAARAHIE
ncbi:GTP-binding protein [Neiella marina]|uniref:GTP-binding protein n=1 Tax=Neiella holothuriorum TaxID=2870530 RepID=A0ABS7EKL8_9GAMM|nr:GTP-binding protein [Neiella holothuriorum]